MLNNLSPVNYKPNIVAKLNNPDKPIHQSNKLLILAKLSITKIKLRCKKEVENSKLNESQTVNFSNAYKTLNYFLTDTIKPINPIQNYSPITKRNSDSKRYSDSIKNFDLINLNPTKREFKKRVIKCETNNKINKTVESSKIIIKSNLKKKNENTQVLIFYS
jgi:hypothetical protein